MNYYNEIDPFAAEWIRNLIKADDEQNVQKLLRSQGVARIEDILQSRFPAIIKRLKELEKK